MKRFLSIKRLSFMFFGLFAVLVAGAMTFQAFWLNPGKRCEADGNWYDVESRTCATPIYIPDITHRPAGVTRAEASAAKNAELVKLENQAVVQQAAIDAAVQKERAKMKAEGH
ncbi:hypothetical protein [Brevundimonas goettingensis]|uniref:Uncharacterized protein n=1 Tax=Brevundimonas goettingensis TaxID=2774190 RepID=A0A975GUP9_9CAUL|nr:hypothetical protein [Brevundimonas goettingensis]QTC90491.1 hypothetical protein IFJ75_14585 [Brevundimonas goettingensis]